MNLLNKLPKSGHLCFFGDSITAGGLWIRDIMDHLVSHHSDLRVMPFNCGVPGDSASNALQRLYCDCIGYFPDVAVVMFGMNDVGRDLYGKDGDEEVLKQRADKLALYEKSLRTIVESLLEINTEVILCSPTPYDEWSAGDTPVLYGCDGALERCRDIVCGIADEKKLGFVDLHTLFLAQMKQHPDTNYVEPDRVHPNDDGHRLMAKLFLEETGVIDRQDNFSPTKSESNWKRFDLEFLLRGMSFIDWCLNYDITEDWDTAVERIHENLNRALSWNNEGVTGMVEKYKKHKANQERLRGQLIQLTLQMYNN